MGLFFDQSLGRRMGRGMSVGISHGLDQISLVTKRATT
jgi:hypothetical protein